MDLTIFANLFSSINPIVLGGIAAGTGLCGVAALYVKKNKNKFLENTENMKYSNDFKTLRTEELEKEFGNLTVQTKLLNDDSEDGVFFNNVQEENLKEDTDFSHPSSKLVEEASVFDCFNKYDKAIELLKKAFEIETHDKEKVRLKILLNDYNYSKGKNSLDNLIKEYPSFHAKNTLKTGSLGLNSNLISQKDSQTTSLPSQNKQVFDIFNDLPIVEASPINTSKTTVESNDLTSQNPFENNNTETNIFNDLPVVEEIPVSNTSKTTVESNDLTSQNPFENNNTETNIFNDLPVVEEIPVSNTLKTTVESNDLNSQNPFENNNIEPNIFNDLPAVGEIPVSNTSKSTIENNDLNSQNPFENNNTETNIFNDLPVVGKMPVSNTSKSTIENNDLNSQNPFENNNTETNIFNDLPVVGEIPMTNTSKSTIESNDLNSQNPFENNNIEPNIFNDLPVVGEIPVTNTSKSTLENNDLNSQNPFENNNVEPIQEDHIQENQFDQFSWTSNKAPTIENPTEQILKELQKDAEIIDKVNENEAIDDMSKFWKEFGNMVSDIQAEVSENNISSNNSIPELQDKENLSPIIQEQKQEVPDLSNIMNDELPIPQDKINNLSMTEDIQTPIVNTSVLNELLEENLSPIIQEQKQEVPDLSNIMNDELPIPQDKINNLSAIEEIQTPIANTPVLKEVIEDTQAKQIPIVTKEDVKPSKPFKIWANWIVTIQGQQVFRNHFINLTNPWGTTLAAEELYMGINKLSGKTPDNKNYPWVLVSVFPLAK